MDAGEETHSTVILGEDNNSQVETIPVEPDTSLVLHELDCITSLRSREISTVEESAVPDESAIHDETEKDESSVRDDSKEDPKTGEESTELPSETDRKDTEKKMDTVNTSLKNQEKGETQDPTIVPRATRYFAHDLRGDAA